MAFLTAKVDDFYKVARDYETASGRVGKVGRKAMEEWAKRTLGVQQSHAPVLTGALQADLMVELHGDGRSGNIWATVGMSPAPPREGWFQELGTSRMPAHPFIAPSELVAEMEGPGLMDKVMGEVSDGL